MEAVVNYPFSLQEILLEEEFDSRAKNLGREGEELFLRNNRELSPAQRQEQRNVSQHSQQTLNTQRRQLFLLSETNLKSIYRGISDFGCKSLL